MEYILGYSKISKKYSQSNLIDDKESQNALIVHIFIFLN